ncbi:calmodulin-like protein [Umbelopsis sp. AD052]|nr:calmodulin-like protein [Umbelopsis sp. AD052]
MTVNIEERESLLQVFKIFDKNGDGNVSIQEFAQVLEHLGVTSSQIEAKAIIRRVGRQNSTSMNFEEFVDAIEATTTNANDHPSTEDEEQLRDCFRAFDKNGDGRISFDELAMAMKELGEDMTREELEEMMRDGDADKDGMIDFDEFKRLMPNA